MALGVQHRCSFEPLRVAKSYLALRGRTAREFADFHQKSEQWVYAVFNGRASAPSSFRHDLAIFLGVPEELLFPQAAQEGRAS